MGGEKHAEAPWGYFRLMRDGTWHIYHDPYKVLADEPALASLHGPDAEANGQRIVYCVNACKGIPTVCLGPGLENAVLGELVEMCRALDLNARGRSGGAVYMINRDHFLRFRNSLHNLKPQEIRP